MDFSWSDEQQAIADLAGRVLAEGASHERQRELEQGDGPRFDRALWRQLAGTGLLGTAVPEAFGGTGLGFLELTAILEQAGRHAAPAPLLETLVLGALPVARFGSEALRREVLPAVAEGRCVMTAALQEDGDDALAALPPATRAVRRGEGWRLDGRKLCVPAGAVADRLLVHASLDEELTGVLVVPADAAGLSIVPCEATHGRGDAHLELDDVRVGADALLGGAEEAASVAPWIALRATAAQCAVVLGLCEAALALTAEHVKTRKQFDQPLAMFQAVGHRLADAYVDTEAVRLTTWQACWRVAADRPAEAAVSVAKFWAAEGGQRVVHAAQHLHGGIGVDRDYPLHRPFLQAKALELQGGGATVHLLRLGRLLAEPGDPAA